MYGYQNSENVGPGKSGGKFGLNTGFVTKFEFNPNAGAGGSTGEAIDFTVQIGEREYRHRFFPISKVYRPNGGGEITDTSSDEYKDTREKEVNLFNATISDIVKCFIPEEDLKLALATPISTFRDFATIVTRLVQSSPNWQKKPVDVFLQYQWSPAEDKDKTYLELPKNVKHGAYIVASQGEGFKEERTETGLKYVKDDVAHPFKRNEWYVGSAFANQIVLTGGASMNASTSESASSSSSSGW